MVQFVVDFLVNFKMLFRMAFSSYHLLIQIMGVYVSIDTLIKTVLYKFFINTANNE